jgi:Mg/Co/Ni transporter MgtE
VAPQIAESAYGFALVTTRGGVLLGRLRKSLCDVDPDTAVERVMESGPSTVRPDLLAEELAGRLRERDLKTAVVSTPEGVLIGVVRRSELKKAS